MRVSASVLAVLACASLCACGPGTPGPSATPAAPGSSAPAGTPTPSESPDSRPGALPEQLRGSWVAVEANPQALVSGREPRISLDGAVIGAQAGCNTASGDLAVNGEQLVVNRLRTTRAACADAGVMEQETWFLRLLEADPQWRLEGDRLVLTAHQDRVVLRRA